MNYMFNRLHLILLIQCCDWFLLSKHVLQRGSLCTCVDLCMCVHRRSWVCLSSEKWSELRFFAYLYWIVPIDNYWTCSSSRGLSDGQGTDLMIITWQLFKMLNDGSSYQDRSPVGSRFVFAVCRQLFRMLSLSCFYCCLLKRAACCCWKIGARKKLKVEWHFSVGDPFRVTLCHLIHC